MGLNDYKVRVKEKKRVYHANLLKKYFEREDSVPVGAVAVEGNANGRVESEEEEEEVDPVESTGFLEIGGYDAKESVNDVAIGHETFLMSKEQSLWILQTSFKACSQKPQAQQVWLSIKSSLHPTNQLDRDHIQYRIA